MPKVFKKNCYVCTNNETITMEIKISDKNTPIKWEKPTLTVFKREDILGKDLVSGELEGGPGSKTGS